MKVNRSIAVLAALALAGAAQAQLAAPSAAGAARYATDAYPGFESEAENVKPERKEPRWFAFINGPNRESAAEQFAYCQELVQEGDFKKAAKQLDALVREWPTAPEAWKAQQQLAELLLERLEDYEEAFREYRYLLDFYSLQCDFRAVADRLYEVAGILRREGKDVMFIRFANTVDVRRAYEACVFRAPGASWVPEAMLIIASLRADEDRLSESVKVYENLRNLYPTSPEAKEALLREATARMEILRECEYNRARNQDTLDFVRQAIVSCRPEDIETLQGYRDELIVTIEEDDFRSAKFYDSVTRTRRSAVNAYEKFLENYPQSAHAEEVRLRLSELKGAEQ